MKIKQIKYIGLLGLALTLNSCNDVDLNSAPYDSVAVGQIITDSNSASAAVNGMYDLLFRTNYYGRALMVNPEVAADNVLVSPENSGRFVSEYNYAVLPTNGTVEDVWTNLYKNVNAANTVLNFAKSAGLTTELQNEVEGHAYAIRGMAHFDLVRNFAFPYTTSDATVAPGANGAGGHLGVPLLVEYNQARHTPRASVSEVYSQVISDLEKAISLLPATTSDNQSKFNKSGIQALLSRVYLYKGDYANAYNMANAVISSGNYSLPTNSTYMNNWKGSIEKGAILQLPVATNDNNGFNSLGSIYVKKGIDGNNGYGDLLPTADIMNLYGAGDVRNQWFKATDGVTYNVKYPNSWLTAIPVVRLAEVYLNLAEAAAMGGGSSTVGADALNKIRQIADPTAADVALSIDAVKVERRKELAFEGHRMYDIVRWKDNMVRQDKSTPAVLGELVYPDYRMIWPIPQKEIDANDSINENNVGY